jgi:hypothetical protein
MGYVDNKIVVIDKHMVRVAKRDNAVGVVTGCGLDDPGVGVLVPVWSRIFFSRRPDRIWGPPCLLASGYRWLFLRGKAARV